MSRLKVKMSRYYWIALYVFLIMGSIVEIGLTCFFLRYGSFEDPVLDIFFMLFIPLMLGFVALLPWKYLMTMQVEETVIRSFLFGKLKCEVYTNREVYYALFRCRETNTNSRDYIAISNEMFIYKEGKRTFWSTNTFIDRYDRTKQIIFPYDEKTKHLFPLEKWTRVN